VKWYLLAGFLWVILVYPLAHWAAYRQSKFSRMRAEYAEQSDYIGDNWFALLYAAALVLNGLTWPYSMGRFIWLRVVEIRKGGSDG
jgi:hypothetical protein